jgi:hypothetical protein
MDDRLDKYKLDGRWSIYSVKSNTRASDARNGRDNDMDLDFVKEIMSKSCHYCRRFSSRRTIDRIDNFIGHIKTNVVPSCLRCNLVRGAMPYEAWMVVAEGIREADSLGLFNGWEGQTYEG